MFIAVIAALGAIMAPQDLADIAASGVETVSVALPDSMSLAEEAGRASITASTQSFSAQVSGTRVEVGGAPGAYRTGDISMSADSVGSGVQSYVLNTGSGSLGQSGVSIAAGALNFGAPQK